MKLCVLLLLCVLLCAADRRRSDRGDGAEQQRIQHRRHDDDERRQHHHHDNERRQHYYHDDERRQHHRHDDDDDDEDDHHHGQRRKFSHLADADGESWRHTHDHDRRGRPDGHGHGWTQRDGQPRQNDRRDRVDSRQDRRSEDRDQSGRHQEPRRQDDEHRDHHASEKKHKGDKKTHRGEERRHGRRSDGDAAGEDVPQEGVVLAAGQHQTEGTERPMSQGPPTEVEDAPAVAAEPAAEALVVAEPDVAGLGEEEAVTDTISPPPHEDVAAMARYIVHVSDWAAMATISTREPTRGMPFANVFSVCDGTRYRSTGIPYLYLTDMEISVKDLRVSNNASLTMSLAQTDFCQQRGYDPEDPLCAHVILSGQVLQVDEKDPEFVFARDALFSRHPEMSGWPANHDWFVAKLDIQNIIVLDYFGGAKTVTVKEYFDTNPFKVDPRRANMV